jgi:hypothetical protein
MVWHKTIIKKKLKQSLQVVWRKIKELKKLGQKDNI